jgi:hypothetical protein
MGKAADLAGTRYGSLTAIERNGTNASGKAQWLCLCDCGAQVSALAQNLKAGNTRSCGTHGQGAGPAANQQPERYRIVAIDGPKLGMQPSAYGFCEVFDAESKELLFRNEPLSRLETAGEPSPNGARGMTWLQQQTLIEPKRNMTWRQWLIAARVTVDHRTVSDAAAVEAAWESSAGRALRDKQSGEQPSFLPTIQQIPDVTPAQKYAVDVFLSDDTDGAEHMRRYPLSDEAQRELMLKAARKGGQAALDVAIATAKRELQSGQ